MAPKQNPFAGLMASRAVWLAISDAVFSTILYFAAKYAGAASSDIQFVVTIYQPIIGLVIGKMGIEDVAQTQAKAKVDAAHVEAGGNVAVAQVEARSPTKVQNVQVDSNSTQIG